MQIIDTPLAGCGSVGPQLLGRRPFAVLSVECEVIIPIIAECSRRRSLGDIDIESCTLWLRASDESRGGEDVL